MNLACLPTVMAIQCVMPVPSDGCFLIWLSQQQFMCHCFVQTSTPQKGNGLLMRVILTSCTTEIFAESQESMDLSGKSLAPIGYISSFIDDCPWSQLTTETKGINLLI